MNRSRKLTFLAGGVAIAAIGAVVSYFVIQQGDGSAEAKDVVEGPAATAVPVEVVEAIQGPVTKTLSSSSTIEAEQSAEVLAKVSGIVTEVAVREGTAVEKDQVLARIDDEEKKLALEKADLTLRKAEAELNRSKLSFDQELISRFDYEKAVFDRDLARTEKQIKELEYRYAVIRAPFAGRVTATEIVVGRTIQPGDHLVTLADFRTLVVRLFLPEKDVFQLKPGQPVGLLPEALAGASMEDVSFRGRVRDISPVVDPKTGTVKVTVEVLDRSADIRPGAFVRAEIETDRRIDAVLVPKLAVVTEGGENFVFVVNEGRAEKRPVELGYTRGAAVEILAGISPEEKIAIAGHTTLEDGESVEVLTK
ncbi:MAG TPA: efflux RND transporter periplasmic adaptor subunit [Vicinamibacteria bacterium]|nr:efflux RND transporter periplasmic adaptor subunit [Vicinamibacteria bacterium]